VVDWGGGGSGRALVWLRRAGLGWCSTDCVRRGARLGAGGSRSVGVKLPARSITIGRGERERERGSIRSLTIRGRSACCSYGRRAATSEAAGCVELPGARCSRELRRWDYLERMGPPFGEVVTITLVRPGQPAGARDKRRCSSNRETKHPGLRPGCGFGERELVISICAE
jgi:hypothetical protein